jgi:DNA-binding GntR family transcriptional regulator
MVEMGRNGAQPAVSPLGGSPLGGSPLGGTVAPRPLTLREHALRSIRQAITSGTLAPGTRIREEELAQQLGISRGPVREAIRALEREGLVRTEPHRGSYVTALAEEEIEHLYQVRATVEAIASRRVAQRIAGDAGLLTPYQELLERMRRAAASGGLDTLAAADLEVHRRLLADSGYTVLPELWSAMDGIVRARMSAILAEQPRGEIVPYTAESHAPIVEALQSGDPERAAAAVQQHILETRDLWMAVRRRAPWRIPGGAAAQPRRARRPAVAGSASGRRGPAADRARP